MAILLAFTISLCIGYGAGYSKSVRDAKENFGKWNGLYLQYKLDSAKSRGYDSAITKRISKITIDNKEYKVTQ